MRNAVIAYAKEHKLVKRGNRYYDVVFTSRPTKFLGWCVMGKLHNDEARISPFFKTRAEAEVFQVPGTEVRRRFESKGKQHLRVHRIPSYLRRKGWEHY